MKQNRYKLTMALQEAPPRVAMGRWSTILLIAAGTLILSAPPLRAATIKKEMTDKGITSVAEDRLAHEKGVFPSNVDVSTIQGIVTLSGAVDNLLAKDRAVKIVESIRGVRGAIDLITVTPVSRPDDEIRKDILTALLQDPATEHYPVGVSVQNAGAVLTGSVGSYAEQQLAARIAKGVKGIKTVRNDVTINYQTKRTDTEIANDIKALLQWDIWINGDRIYTAVKDGNVKLSGTSGSAISASRAVDDAWVNGVTSVDFSGIKIDPWAGDDARRKLKFVIRSDSEIKQAIQLALRLDPRVADFSPEVSVDEGIVRLSGAVGNLKAKTAAEQDAKNIISVWQVVNYLKVKPKALPTDTEMANQLKAALIWDPLLDSSTIDATVSNRVAYLAGTVDSSFQKAEAQDVASRIKGVGMVRNRLKVEQEFSTVYYDWPYFDSSYYIQPYYYGSEMFARPDLSDEQIKKNVENGFSWSPFVDSDDIKVTVNAGVATLTGTVKTWIGWNEADKDAHTSGAINVLNRLTVKKSSWFWQ